MQKTRFKTGFTIAELLISIAISAMLLVAVAVAFNASATNYCENEEIFRTINSARQALSRITSDIRTSIPDLNAPPNECRLAETGLGSITYLYDSNDVTLYLITNSGQHVLCENVMAMNFRKTPTDDGLDCKSVQILMTVASGDAQRTLSTAAVARRNLN